MDNDRFIRPEEAVSLLRVTPGTLRSWANKGKIECTTTKGNHRRYKLSSVLNLKEGKESLPPVQPIPKRKICYARVSSYTQKKDLETQLKCFQTRYPTHTIVKDLGSGLNFKRKGFLSLLDGAIKGNIEEIVVTHKDRLCRFGYEIFDRILSSQGGKIVVLDNQKLSPEQELVQDLLTITTVFSSRLYGLRSHSLKRKIRAATKTSKTQPDGKAIQDLTNENLSDQE
jgi:predicted site-specific integrase-resolvase